jgi:hypothetical protein
MLIARVAQAMVGVAIVLFTLNEYDSPALAGVVTLRTSCRGSSSAPSRALARSPRSGAA